MVTRMPKAESRKPATLPGFFWSFPSRSQKPRKQKARPCEPGQELDFLVPLDGIELSTFALRMRDSG